MNAREIWGDVWQKHRDGAPLEEGLRALHDAITQLEVERDDAVAGKTARWVVETAKLEPGDVLVTKTTNLDDRQRSHFVEALQQQLRSVPEPYVLLLEVADHEIRVERRPNGEPPFMVGAIGITDADIETLEQCASEGVVVEIESTTFQLLLKEVRDLRALPLLVTVVGADLSAESKREIAEAMEADCRNPGRVLILEPDMSRHRSLTSYCRIDMQRLRALDPLPDGFSDFVVDLRDCIAIAREIDTSNYHSITTTRAVWEWLRDLLDIVQPIKLQQAADPPDSDLRDEYDFSKGVRGKYTTDQYAKDAHVNEHIIFNLNITKDGVTVTEPGPEPVASTLHSSTDVSADRDLAALKKLDCKLIQSDVPNEYGEVVPRAVLERAAAAYTDAYCTLAQRMDRFYAGLKEGDEVRAGGAPARVACKVELFCWVRVQGRTEVEPFEWDQIEPPGGW